MIHKQNRKCKLATKKHPPNCSADQLVDAPVVRREGACLLVAKVGVLALLPGMGVLGRLDLGGGWRACPPATGDGVVPPVERGAATAEQELIDPCLDHAHCSSPHPCGRLSRGVGRLMPNKPFGVGYVT